MNTEIEASQLEALDTKFGLTGKVIRDCQRPCGLSDEIKDKKLPRPPLAISNLVNRAVQLVSNRM
jgi:hypothetical protein